MLSGSGPLRSPVSRPSMAATSSGLSAKSKTSRFSAMRCALTDLGIAHRPWSRCRRRTTWAAVLPYLSASAVTAGSSRALRPPLGAWVQ